MGDKAQGLLPKYQVTRTDGKPVGFCFVLEPARDPLAIAALDVYAVTAGEEGYKALERDLSAITRQYRTVVCHDCAWTGFPEQLTYKRGKRQWCPQCDSTNVHKKVVEADLSKPAGTALLLDAAEREFVISLCEMYEDENAQYPQLAELVARAGALRARLEGADRG